MSSKTDEEKIVLWFEKELLPDLVAKGTFADGFFTVKQLTWEASERNDDQFASCPYFLTITLENQDDKRIQDFHLVVKFMTPSLAVRTAMECDVQFYNEMIFYNKVVPTFQSYLDTKPNVPKTYLDDICPKCYYANIDLDQPEYGIVILNDLRQTQFRTAVSKVELDLDHCLVSMRKLAKFHAISYGMKLDNCNELDNLKTSFRECRYQEEKYKEYATGCFIGPAALRGISYLEQQNGSEVPLEYLKLLRAKTENCYKLMQKMIIPEEPLAIICHGDFCRNNILYRLDNGKAIDCRLFDYQTFRYSNPSIDLTFFMYMNTTPEIREKHFDEILMTYHSTLLENIALITSQDVQKISETHPLSLFKKDFSEHSLYGYVTIAFFIPIMISPPEISFEEMFNTFSPQESAEQNVRLGGEPVTKIIADVIKDMYRRKFYLE